MGSRLDRVTDWEKMAPKASYHAGLLATSCGVSDRQLCRYFLLHHGVTAQAWLDRHRLSLAETMLSEGIKIEAVAKELAFSHASHFYRFFKAHMGATPHEFMVAQVRATLVSGRGDSPTRPNTFS